MKLNDFQKLCDLLTTCESRKTCDNCPYVAFCILNTSYIDVADIIELLTQLDEFKNA